MNDPNSPRRQSNIAIWLLGFIALGIAVVATAAVLSYLRVRATADRIEKRVDNLEMSARAAASRATSATRATLSAAAGKIDDTAENLTSATKAGLQAAADRVDRTGDRISSASASATSRTKALLSAPGEKWREMKARSTEVTTETDDVETSPSGRFAGLKSRLNAIRNRDNNTTSE